MTLAFIFNAFIACLGQYNSYDDLNEVPNQRRNDDGVTERELEYYELDDVSTTEVAQTTVPATTTTTTTTTSTTTARPAALRTTRRSTFRAKNKFATNQLSDSFNDASENLYVQKSRPIATALTRNAVDRAENRKEDRSSSDDDAGNYFSRRYARFLFRQRSG